jgi:hypothetical protein
MRTVTRDGEVIVIDNYNPPVSLRLTVSEAATLRDEIEAAIMDYDARQEGNIEAQPQPKTAEVAIALMNRLDELVKRGRHILVAEDILLKAVNEWRSATDNHS